MNVWWNEPNHNSSCRVVCVGKWVTVRNMSDVFVWAGHFKIFCWTHANKTFWSCLAVSYYFTVFSWCLVGFYHCIACFFWSFFWSHPKLWTCFVSHSACCKQSTCYSHIFCKYIFNLFIIQNYSTVSQLKWLYNNKHGHAVLPQKRVQPILC